MRVLKRAIDVAASLAGLLLLAPLLLLAALAVACESGWPVIFVQQRVGRGCQAFGMYKFRTMVKNAASVGPYFTAAGDPRITRVGHWLRRTSIDELPQLLNVLRGDMSLVGPRPDLAVQQSHYSAADWAQRHQLRPGITGLAQALYRSDATYEQRLAADLRYCQESSLWLDAKIMLWTLRRLRLGTN